MLNYVMNQYKEICSLTYHNFEIYHIQALNRLFDGDISARDVQILAFIYHSKDQVAPTQLKDVFKMNFSALSNRLAVFEKLDIIKRDKPDAQKKMVHIQLTKAGELMVLEFDAYTNQFLDKLKQSFSLWDAFTINATWNQLKKMVYGNENDENPTGKKMISTNFLFDLYNYFTAFELEWIEKNQIPFKQRELFFLSELYLHIETKKYTYKNLAEHLMIPYQTLMSKIQKYKRDGVILSKETMDDLNPDILSIVHEYIYLRTIIYYETMSHFQPKQQRFIIKLFAILKAHALDHFNS